MRPDVEVNRDFEIPSATADQKALLELLALIPDTPDNRVSLMLRDVELWHSIIGWERLTYEDGADAWLERLMSEDNAAQHLPRVAADGPFLSGFHRYTSQMKTYGSLGFDQRNVDQTVLVGGLPETTGIVAGRYDPEFSAQLLAECGCPQPRVTEYGGYEYGSWDEEDYRGELTNRLAAPAFDNVGRGGHVLITEVGLYRTLGEPLMRQLIDTLNGEMPSLADNDELRFVLDVMGAHQAYGVIISDMEFQDTESLMEHSGTLRESGSSNGPTYTISHESNRENALLAPLLKPYSRIGMGTGWDGSEGFEVLVLVNEDEATAAENADRLVDRVLNSNKAEGLPWGTEISRIDVSVSGKFTVARFYSERGESLHSALNHGLLLAVE